MSDLKFNVPNFEGPLELLLNLIRLNEAQITDIPISEITNQFLEFIEMMEVLDFEVAGDFLIMAATLMRIKSKMLLPRTEGDDEEEWEDPRKELVERLLEYKKYKELAIHLGDRLEKHQNTYQRNFALLSDEYRKGNVSVVDIDLFGLIFAYKKILTKLSSRIPEEIEGEEFTIEEKQSFITERLKSKKVVKFSEIFIEAKSKKEIVVIVMAILEMIRGGGMRIQQTELFGEIYMYHPEAAAPKEETEAAEETCE